MSDCKKSKFFEKCGFLSAVLGVALLGVASLGGIEPSEAEAVVPPITSRVYPTEYSVDNLGGDNLVLEYGVSESFRSIWDGSSDTWVHFVCTGFEMELSNSFYTLTKGYYYADEVESSTLTSAPTRQLSEWECLLHFYMSGTSANCMAWFPQYSWPMGSYNIASQFSTTSSIAYNTNDAGNSRLLFYSNSGDFGNTDWTFLHRVIYKPFLDYMYGFSSSQTWYSNWVDPESYARDIQAAEDRGYSKGISARTDVDNGWNNIIGGIVSIPMKIFSGLSVFAVWKTPIIYILFSLLFASVILFVIRKLLK